MADGRQLAARLFLPRTADEHPVPVILEYIPYRRRDGTRLGDEAMHRWFAAHGYASVRVDIAGMGDSDGEVEDEYVLREQDDGVEVIAWLAAQPWSTGAVGMIGISWGGFNGLQIAARRPPALKAVISLCSTVDRYHGDVHYTGGCLNEENLEWGGYFFAMHGFPPDPAIVGDRWKEMWLHRIEHAMLPPATWLEHQHRDDFWRHGSVVEDLSAIEVPVLAVSGWADGYTDTVFDLVEGLGAVGTPCKGIIGPWGHKYPQDGIPGPAIGFLQEATRWWGQWLKGESTGVTDDPDVRLWLEDSITPIGHVPVHPGRWVGFDEWPDGRAGDTDRVAPRRRRGRVPQPVDRRTHLDRALARHHRHEFRPVVRLRARQDRTRTPRRPASRRRRLHRVRHRPAGRRDPPDRPAVDLPASGRRSSSCPGGRTPLRRAPRRHLRTHQLRSVQPVPPRRATSTPSALVPGQAVDVTIPLKGIAHTLPAGHRLRVAVSSCYWPMIWPSPELTTLTLHDAHCHVSLPIVTERARTARRPVRAAAGRAHRRVTVVRPGVERRWTHHDLDERRTDVVASRDDGVYVLRRRRHRAVVHTGCAAIRSSTATPPACRPRSPAVPPTAATTGT